MRSKCHSSLTFTVCCLNASLCVGAAQQQQRAAQWVRSCKALAPSLHHLSISTRLIFALPLSVFTPSTLTPGVFIRWVGALSTVSLQLILTVLLLSPPPPSLLTPGSDLESPIPGCFVVTGSIITTPRCQLSVREHTAQAWAVTSKFFSIQTLSPFLSLALSLFPPGLADYVWVSLELVCF